MKSKRKFYSKRRVRMCHSIFAAFDTETRGLGGETLAATCFTDENVPYFFTASTPPDIFTPLWEVMLSRADVKNLVWLAHNFQYDLRQFLPWILDRKDEENSEIDKIDIRMRTDTDIFEIEIALRPSGKIVMRDSMAFWPGDLRSLVDTFAPEIPKLHIDVENFDPEDPAHQAYAKRDAEALAIAFRRASDLLVQLFGVDIGPTAASTAMRAWQASLPPQRFLPSSSPGPVEDFMRAAYFGGLVFLTSTEPHENCVTYDVNSSYPSSMREFGIPLGSPLHTKTYRASYPGIYRCRVTTPTDLVVPIIPFRTPKGQVLWPAGSFETHITSLEIDFARQHGYTIEVQEGYFWPFRGHPFSEFVDTCEHLRAEYRKQPAEVLVKLMQNSVYGKFGSKRARPKIVIDPTEILGMRPLDVSGRLFLTQDFCDSLMCQPAYAAFITAHARLRLLSAIYATGPSHVLYGDTDSITIKADVEPKFPVGLAYGEFKKEKVWSSFRALGPKLYAGEIDGRFTGKAKGLARKAVRSEHFKALHAGDGVSVSALSLDSLKVALGRGLTATDALPAKMLTRKSSVLDHSANWRRLLNGDVRPREIKV